jgi:hypothetical protein
MRQVLAAVVILVSAALVTGADDEKYTSKAGKYAVAFPAGAKVKTDVKDAGGLKMNFAIVEDQGNAFAVIHIDLPEQPKGDAVKAFLDSVENGALRKTGAKVVESKDTTFGKEKYPSREVVMEKDGTKGRARLILVETRVYAILVRGPGDFATGKDADRFLDSFELTK